MPSNRPVVVTGPPASGKSTIVRAVAALIGCERIDLDEEISRAAGESIAAMFASRGESAFRAAERAALERALQQRDVVIAAGGGALVDPVFRRSVLARAHVIALQSDRATLLARLANDATDRPRLRGDTPALLDALLASRADGYAEAHAVIDAGGSPDAVATAVHAAIESLRRDETLVVPLGARTYRVIVGRGDRLAEEIATLAPSRTVWLTDQRVRRRVGGPLRFGVTARPAATVTLRGRGDADKTLAAVRAIWDASLAAEIDRDAVIVGAGGGVVTDLAGFAAATLLRGIRFATAPTTLLAMVDASVGGKTGFDHRAGKNLIGAFHQPSVVVCDPSVLTTLAPRELRAGLAEIVKIALVCDASLLAAIEARTDDLRALRLDAIASLVAPAIQAKIDVVARDEREAGERALLNFGHTLGHAIEQAARYTVPHGECVALGMRAAIDLGVEAGITPRDLGFRAHTLFDALGFVQRAPRGVRLDAVMTALAHDKKRKAGTLRFVLVDRPGHGVVHPVARAEAERAAERLLEIRGTVRRRVRS